MKIIYDFKAFLIQPYGGISRYYKYLAEKLDQKGHDVKILAGCHHNNYLKDLDDEIVIGYKLNHINPYTQKIFGVLNHFNSEFKINQFKPDVVHETYFSSLPNLIKKKVSVTTVHDMIHEIYQPKNSLNNKVNNSKKLTLSRVEHIICVSKKTKNNIKNYFNKLCQFTLIKN